MKWSIVLLPTLAGALLAGPAASADSGNQVFYRGGIAFLKSARSSQVFTDTNAANGSNSGTTGWDVGAGVDLALSRSLGPGDLLGEIAADYAHFSSQRVAQTTSALLGGHATDNVTVSALNVLVAPKYRFNGVADGKLRPWIIPVGLSFLVNSPPSNDSTYLDVGYTAGVGVEYLLISALSVGVDFRYTLAADEPGTRATYGTADLYVGVNF